MDVRGVGVGGEVEVVEVESTGGRAASGTCTGHRAPGMDAPVGTESLVVMGGGSTTALGVGDARGRDDWLFSGCRLIVPVVAALFLSVFDASFGSRLLAFLGAVRCAAAGERRPRDGTGRCGRGTGACPQRARPDQHARGQACDPLAVQLAVHWVPFRGVRSAADTPTSTFASPPHSSPSPPSPPIPNGGSGPGASLGRVCVGRTGRWVLTSMRCRTGGGNLCRLDADAIPWEGPG